MSGQIGEQVRNYQEELHTRIEEAMFDFTKKTGLIVTDLRFDLQRIYDRDSETVAVLYHDIFADLSSGL